MSCYKNHKLELFKHFKDYWHAKRIRKKKVKTSKNVLYSHKMKTASVWYCLSPLFNTIISCSLPCQKKSNRLEDKLICQNMTYVFLSNLHIEVTRVDFTMCIYVFLLLWFLSFCPFQIPSQGERFWVASIVHSYLNRKVLYWS